MVTIKVCDECKAKGVLRESKWRVGLKGNLKVDLCEEHKNDPPKKGAEFVKWMYQIVHGIEVTEEQAAQIARGN